MRFLISISLIACTISIFPGCVPTSSDAPTKSISETVQLPTTAKTSPNIIWILLDACRAENLSCYGNDRLTSPVMDALAARGVLFEQAYAQSNWTARSVPSYMTGKYFAVSCLDLGGRVTFMRTPPADEQLFPTILRENGYRSAMFSTHMGFIRPGCRLWRAFDEAFAVKFQMIPRIKVKANFEDVNAQVLPWLSKAKDKPFFLYVHTVDTHFPHVLAPPYDQWVDPAYDTSQLADDGSGQVYRRKDGQPYNDADKAYFRGLYEGSIRYADEQIGVLLKELESLGLADNTIVVISSDHGEALGEDGHSFEHTHGGSADNVFRVPFIVAGPGIPKGVRIASPVENVDIVPTLLSAIGAKSTAKHDGVDLMPFARGEKSGVVKPYVSAYYIGQNFPHPPPYDDEPAMFVRTDAYKFETDPTISQSYLWRVPDELSARVNVIAEQPAEAARIKQILETERRTLREAYLALPYRQMQFEGFSIARAIGDESLFAWWGKEDDVAQQTDNKWAVQDRYLWCANWSESPPPLKLSVPADAGTYRVQISVLSSQDHAGKPASSVSASLEDGPAIVSTLASLPSAQAGFEMINLGEIAVTDGHLDIQLGKGLDGYWTVIGRVVITPITPEGVASPDAATEGNQSFESIQEGSDTLKSIGYL